MARLLAATRSGESTSKGMRGPEEEIKVGEEIDAKTHELASTVKKLAECEEDLERGVFCYAQGDVSRN